MTTAAAHDIDPAHIGSFTGDGRWVDETGQAMDYTIEQTLEMEGKHPVLRFLHTFADGTETRAEFELQSQGNGFFEVVASGNAIGRGYANGADLVYYLDLPSNHVSVRTEVTDAELLVAAYSTRNSDGHFIYWQERLIRDQAP